MLDVHGGHHVHPSLQQVEDVLVPFRVAAARHVGMSEFIDDAQFGFAADDPVDVHFL